MKEGNNEMIINILREIGVDAHFQNKKLYIPKGKMKKVKNLFNIMMSTSNFRPPILVGESVSKD